MKKSEALQFASDKYSDDFESDNTHFSSVNNAKPVWWFEIPLAKIEDDKYQKINLITENSGEVGLLQVPVKYLRDNLSGLKIRYTKQVICLEIDIDSYQNKVGSKRIEFKQFVK